MRSQLLQISCTIIPGVMLLLAPLLPCLCAAPANAVPAYPVQKIDENGIVTINGSRYEPVSRCEGISEGDWVVFLHGNPYGDCASAVIHDLNSDAVCHLWCE